ncbi:hypothetical protein J3R83DRAFT_6408 [Lanmaoa asiatica]|nr:hypothetical protein J3R83DRAFT_6408 [Lanmaoa asiatica]
MSDSLALVRAEIKTWERDFVSRHGRDPTVQDIRDQPPIGAPSFCPAPTHPSSQSRPAEKYKLYKKLSKAAANQTPSRSQSRLPIPKSRPAESVPPLPGFNPFSPVKKSAKHNRPSASQASRTSPHPNPFATPTKSNIKPCPRTATHSPDPFSSVLPPHPNTTASSSHAHPASTTAISRARKRLRGESVSPSPNKPKRQRIRSQAPPIPKLEQDSSNSEHELDQELPQCDLTSSFVADSPVKAPAGGKSFKLLFDDALPALSIAKKPVGSFVAQLDSPPHACFPQRTSAGPSVLPSFKLHHDPKSRNITSGPEHRVSRIQGKTPAQIFPTKNHLPARPHKPTFKTVVPEVSQPKTSIKRALDGGDLVFEHRERSIPLQSQFPLIPPSPPPQDSTNRDAGKGKAKSTASRKRLRVENEESDADEGVVSSDDITLKATISLDRGKHSYRHADDLDWDPLLHLRTLNHDEAAKEQIDANHHAPGTFSIDLPDKFRRVLAISQSRCQNISEERVVRGLLYGDRVGHYDSSRGGDIWDAGETDEGAHGSVETEDDWEGEPVPWEVGEL